MSFFRKRTRARSSGEGEEGGVDAVLESMALISARHTGGNIWESYSSERLLGEKEMREVTPKGQRERVP